MKNSCHIRQNRNLLTTKAFPWTLEMYSNSHRRDFDCKNIGECWRISQAVYGDNFLMYYSNPARRAWKKRWKGIFPDENS